jgi:hypothetical protein
VLVRMYVSELFAWCFVCSFVPRHARSRHVTSRHCFCLYKCGGFASIKMGMTSALMNAICVDSCVCDINI